MWITHWPTDCVFLIMEIIWCLQTDSFEKLCQVLACTTEVCNACSIMSTGFSLCLLSLLASQHEGMKYKSSYIGYALYARGLLFRGSPQSGFMRSPSVFPRHMCWHYTVDLRSPHTPVKWHAFMMWSRGLTCFRGTLRGETSWRVQNLQQQL